MTTPAAAPIERLGARPSVVPPRLVPGGRAGGQPLTRNEIGDLVRRVVDERLAASAGASGGRRSSAARDRSTTTPARSVGAAVPIPRPTVQRQSTAAAPTPPAPAGVDDNGAAEGNSTSEQLDAVERIVAAVERRILAELNRRSGRYGGW